MILNCTRHRVATFVCCQVLFVFGSANDLAAQSSTNRVAPLPQASRTLHRIAFGSCAKHWQHQAIWETIADQNPDLFLFLGDAIYSDTDGKTAWKVTEKHLQGEWNRLADKPEFQRFRSHIPIMASSIIEMSELVAAKASVTLRCKSFWSPR